MQDGIISLETLCPSLIGARTVLRWLFNEIWRLIWQCFAGLGEMASDHEFLTSFPLRFRRVRQMVNFFNLADMWRGHIVCQAVLLPYYAK